MRIRSTKPEFWRSKTIAQLDWATRHVLKGLESYVDDNGVGKDDLALIAADVFPRDLAANPRDTLARLSEAISALVGGGLIVRYERDGEDLLYIDRWKHQQRIDKPGKGRYPRPDGTFEYAEDVDRSSYASVPETLARPRETVAPGTGEQGNRGTGEQGTLVAVATAAPTVNQRAQRMARAYCDVVPLSKFPAMQGIAKKAIESNRYADADIEAAFLRLAADGRSVTTETLRIELEGQPPPGRRPTSRDQQATDDMFARSAARRGIAL